MTRSIAFQKWEATGNDFIFVNARRHNLDLAALPAPTVRAACRRDSGIGADGVVLYSLDSPPGGAGMVIVNSDGSPGDMCGNALRCLAEILWRETGEREHRVMLPSRPVTVRSLQPGTASVDMGSPQPQSGCPLYGSLPRLDEIMNGSGSLLSFGNPHYVVPLADLPEDWERRGAACQAPADELLGTAGINCGFLVREPDDDGRYILRVYERGAGATRSCGSGACAASAVLERRLGLAPPHRLALPGGVLTIDRRGDVFTLTGPVRKEYEGDWTIEL